MRFAVAAAALAGVASASWPAHGGNATASDVYVTEVVTAFTTFCPYATQFTHAGSTYTVSSATTLTITNCPGGCTVTKPVSTSTPAAPVTMSSASTTPVAPVSSSSAPVAPVYGSSSAPAPVAPVYPTSNGTTPVSPVGTGAAKPSTSATGTPAPFTGAASKASAAGAGLLALFGLVAAL